ncbi:MAG TPA: hypothetical protein VGS41_06295, partial [Chthonomonadales bacterium]|nr:hypothetical protein [Chthonomonadales bacterium]
MESEVSAGFRLSPLQANLWAAQADALPLAAQCAVQIECAITESDLANALERAAARYEILRTRYVRPTGMKLPLQVMSETAPALRIVDSESGDPQQVIEQVLCADRQAVGNAYGALLAATMVRFGNNRPVLTLTASALSMDSASLLKLAEEICGSDVIPGNDVLQYADY